MRAWYIVGTVFIIVVGTLMHFVYEWAGRDCFVGIFSSVNESTWEHLKLLFWPALIFSVIRYIFIGKDYNNYITATAVSLYVGMFLIISLFYTYTGIIGVNYLILDISVFILSVIISQNIGYKITTATFCVGQITNIISLMAVALLVLAFVIFTFNPPQIQLFKDPKTGEYGI